MTPTFWNLIQQSKGDPDQLRSLLVEKPDAEVLEFNAQFYSALVELNQWKIWGAGEVMAEGLSNDGFHYFRSWIIGKGEEAFKTALTSPDDLGKFADEDDEFDNEALEYVAVEILEERELEDNRGTDGSNADGEPTGEAWDPEELYSLFPKLAEQFGD
jgi:hypothetical protein